MVTLQHTDFAGLPQELPPNQSPDLTWLGAMCHEARVDPQSWPAADGLISPWRVGNRLYLFAGKHLHVMDLER